MRCSTINSTCLAIFICCMYIFVNETHFNAIGFVMPRTKIIIFGFPFFPIFLYVCFLGRFKITFVAFHLNFYLIRFPTFSNRLTIFQRRKP
ncbi:hypothetical protein RY45_19875 [Aeromonas hydrophila]|nr:hypothetical protein RY45_19875 [Aeromonas hydrophila]